jgi:hypothetical protein
MTCTIERVRKLYAAGLGLVIACAVAACGGASHHDHRSATKETVAGARPATQSTTTTRTKTTLTSSTATRATVLHSDRNCDNGFDYSEGKHCTCPHHHAQCSPPAVHTKAETSTSTTSTTTTSTQRPSSASSPSRAPTPPTQVSPAITAAVAKLVEVTDTDQSDASAITHDFVTLHGKCRETPIKLAGEINFGVDDLHKNGVTGDARTVANALATTAQGLGRAATPTSCASLLAAYLILREPQ